MDAITPTTQLSIPNIDLATLRTVLAECQEQHPEYGGRWHRAAMIVALRHISPALADVAGWWVPSEIDPDKEYFVVQLGARNWTCSCPDYKQRGGPCKHALAVQLLQACECREPGNNLAAFPERVYTDDDRFVLTPLGEAALTADLEPTPAA
jgi:hypothetical protein